MLYASESFIFRLLLTSHYWSNHGIMSWQLSGDKALSPLRLCSLLRMLSDTQFLVTVQGRNLDLIRSLLIPFRQIYDAVSLLSLMCHWHRRWGVGFVFSVLSGYEDYALHEPRGTTLMICNQITYFMSANWTYSLGEKTFFSNITYKTGYCFEVCERDWKYVQLSVW